MLTTDPVLNRRSEFSFILTLYLVRYETTTLFFSHYLSYFKTFDKLKTVARKNGMDKPSPF